MAGTISGAEFAKRVKQSGLLSGVDPSPLNFDDSTAPEIAQRLVDAGHLTPFQADAVLNDRASGLFVGNYTILSQIGAGGMGTVFKARHRRMNRLVALKILADDRSSEASHVNRFQREVETIARLSHPNIVIAHDAGESERGLFLVMEYVDGNDLSVEVSRSGPLSPADAVDCVLQAARGLAYAHQNGIVHRDVKPANLLRDRSGVVKVADLGLAQLSQADPTAVNASLTLAGHILGTADFMAPEQAMDAATVDHRVDIYSLGCTLFYLIAGRPMYSARTIMALLLNHRDAAIPSLSQVRPDLPSELDEIYRRMVAKRPQDRYPTTLDVVHLLDRLRQTDTLSDLRIDRARPFAHDISATDATVAADLREIRELRDLEAISGLSGDRVSARSSELRRLSGFSVVLVEPSRFQARLVRQSLLELGIENVAIAETGQEALNLAKREGTHVVLSSMHLKDMTGIKLFQELRKDPGCAGVGFVLATADDEAMESGRSMETASMVLLHKPFDSDGLARSLAKASGRVLEDILG